jgi:hypothetical protein
VTTPTTVQVQIQLRADTAANWTAESPTLLANEVGLETDTKKLKVGDGTTAWASLAYFPSIVTGGTVLGNLEIGTTGTLTFEGSTADGFETTLAVTDPTAARTITLPDQSGTVVVTGNASIVDADIAANAEIAVSKLANGTANQVLVTDGTDVSWSDDLTLAGNLTVNGTTTTVNTETLTVKDKNIELAVVDTPSDATADGGGITLKGATDKTINWIDATDAWTLSEHVNIASAKEYRIDGSKVLDATSLGSAVVSSSLTSVGTIATGTWQGSAIDATYLDSTVVTTGDTGTVTSTMIVDGTIVNGDINASAAIAGSKISPDFGSQNITTTGTATAAALIPTGSTVPSNGVYLPSANNVAISTNGAQALYINADGDILVADGNRMEIDEIRARDGAGLKLFDDGGAGIFIQDGGRLLVGTSTARQTGGGFTAYSQIEGAGTVSASSLTITSNRSVDDLGPRLNFARSKGGAIGSNTIVDADAEYGGIYFFGADGSDTDSIGAQISAYVDGTPGANDMPGRLVFSSNPGAPATSPSEAMRINSAQELLIGYTSDNGAYKLQVNSQIFATSATIATSDGRYKENVTSLGGCLDLVKALRPVSFTWKPQEDITRIDDEGNEVLVREGHNFPEGNQVGFIAQEVQEVLDGKPWLSSVIKENVRPAVKDNEGNELAPEEQFYGIAEGNLIAVLTNALQEATAQIEDLEARLTAAGL